MKNKLKKYLSILTIISVLFMQTMPTYAQVATPTPTQSDPVPAVSQPTPANSSDQITETKASPTPGHETVTTTPTPAASEQSSSAQTTNQSQTTQPSGTQPQRTGPLSDAEREQRKEAAKAAWEQQFFNANPQLDKTNSGNTGAAPLHPDSAKQGSAGQAQNGSSSIVSPRGASSGSSAVNAGNGAGSDNTSSLSNSSAVAADQNNGAKVGNNVNQTAVTGKTSASFNVGDSTLTTGDANVSGTAITGVNTNLSNVQVSEFNIVDNQKGDLVLSPEAFAANCISGCSTSNATGTGSANIGNGAKSTNTANAQNNSDSTITQTNNAGIGSNLTLTANSGENAASFNTGGDTIINTGDANIAANSLTFANNNLAGNVTFGVVNIYGNLEGDIILPEFANVGSSASNAAKAGAAANTNNGAASTNTASSDITANNNTLQDNNVTIANNITVDGTTGGNSSSDNTNGNTTINTGKTNTDTNVLNVTNTNVSDGTWWLVLVNHAGNWVGKLLGAPDGATMAGSSGTEFKTDANGQITASNGSTGQGSSHEGSGQSVTNNGNGAVSDNTSTVSSTTNTNTTQNNNADIENNLNLSANTGGNKADFNTGGHNTINTGDTNVVANLVNFVNNNISANGRLVVTVVNVFGEWFGDFVTPGQQKQSKPAPNQSSATPGASPADSHNSSNEQSQPSVTQNDNQQSAAANSSSTSSGQSGTLSTNTTQQQPRTERVVSGFSATPDTATQLSENDTIQVAGMSTSDPKQMYAVAGTQEKIIKINLAWMLLLLPLIVFGIIKKIRAKTFTDELKK